MQKPLIVFDMDGVLVDVTESYRESIAQTVKHFTGVEVTREQIRRYLAAREDFRVWGILLLRPHLYVCAAFG